MICVANDPNISSFGLKLAVKGTVPSRRSVGTFKHLLAPAVEDLEIVACDQAWIFYPEHIIESIVIRRKCIGEYEQFSAIYHFDANGIRTTASLLIGYLHFIISGVRY